MEGVMDIDGSVLEGGGQVLRMAIAFSVLQRIPVRIFNIRVGRSKPGLPAFKRSISLLVQLLLPCALFSSGKTVLDLRGGTNADMAPQIDYTTTVFLALLKRFGASFNYDLILRGFYPKGGGKLRVEISPVKHLSPVEMVEPGSIKRIWGSAYTAGNCPLVVGKLMAQSAESFLSRRWRSVTPCIEQRKESQDTAVGTGSGIYIFGETTTGCIYAGTALGKRDVKAEIVGEAAAKELDKSLSLEICVDEHSQDQMIILMALAKGKSRILCGPVTLHTKTAIYVAELMTKAKFTIRPQDKDRNIIECDGIGFENEAL